MDTFRHTNMSCFSIMAAIEERYEIRHSGFTAGSLEVRALGRSPLNPLRAVFFLDALLETDGGDAAALRIIVRRSLRKQKQELEQAKGRGALFSPLSASSSNQ